MLFGPTNLNGQSVTEAVSPVDRGPESRPIILADSRCLRRHLFDGVLAQSDDDFCNNVRRKPTHAMSARRAICPSALIIEGLPAVHHDLENRVRR